MALHVGIDIGSKTVKAVVLGEGGALRFSACHDHRGRIRPALAALMGELDARCGSEPVLLTLTGSGATGIADASGTPFLQEVVATKRAVAALHPGADALIELGGEDAKLVYLAPPVEHRMNTSCAGGTGSFLEDVAALLSVGMGELDELAAAGTARYAIASRCAVFATRDLKPLAAAGCAPEDIAASAYQAVVDQVLGTLACGRPPAGTVLFLGGPMEHLPALVERFRQSMGLEPAQAVKPANAQLMAAWGCALASAAAAHSEHGASPAPVAEHAARLDAAFGRCSQGLPLLPPLQRVPAADAGLPQVALAQVTPPLFAGIDLGSTTLKLALLDAQGRLVYSDYRISPGNVTAALGDMLAQMRTACAEAGLNAETAIARTLATGYGEETALQLAGAQGTLPETTAHLAGALAVFPQASFVLDIGGQDMKALWVEDGALAASTVNETCSSGCGAFMSNAAAALGMSLEELDAAALAAEAPVDLGARCTVFMRSRVRAAQEQGATPADIAAGAAYAVARNALRRLIGSKRMSTLGDSIVVQGGAFASQAVLSAFQQELGRPVLHSPLSPLMGAIGAALTARQQHAQGRAEASAEEAPNVLAFQQELLGAIRGVQQPGTRGAVRVGLLCAMNDYEARPFWHTLLCELGFSVVMPDDCTQPVSQTEVAATLLSDMVCLPAQQINRDALRLLKAGAQIIFCPCTSLGMCAVTREYQLCLPAAMAAAAPEVPVHVPMVGDFAPRYQDEACREPRKMLEALQPLLPAGDELQLDEVVAAVEAGYESFNFLEAQMRCATQEALDWVHASPQRHGILAAGRSYHMRPELMNGTDRVMQAEGFAVIPSMGLDGQIRRMLRPLTISGIDRRRSWLPARHSLGVGALAASDPQLDLVCLQSFGCGIDAVTLSDVQRMVEGEGRPFTLIKLDTKADPAHTRIRIRALAESIRSRRARELSEEGAERCAEGALAVEDAGATDTPGAPGTLGDKPRELVRSTMVPLKPTPHEATLRFAGLEERDAELAQRALPADICGTAVLLAAHGINQAAEHPGMRIQLPSPCKFCITEACQHFVTMEGLESKVDWTTSWPQPGWDAALPQLPAGAPRMGLSGNPLLLFDAVANQGADAFLRSHGVQPVYPAEDSWYSDRDHYLPQLESLAEQGVEHVLLLQSFLCLKTHVYVRGALPSLRARFPQMHFTVVDIDPQASALNVRNRILLAIEELRG